MQNFGEQQEDNSSLPRKVFLGKRTFRVVAVNPDEQWMKDNKVYYDKEKEFVRHGSMQVKDKPEGTMCRFAKIDVFIKDAFEFENPEANSLKISFLLQERYFTSKDGLKAQIINKYGGTLWVPIADARTLTLSNPFIGTTPYVQDGIKLAICGEENLITLIRTLRNLNNVKDDTKPEDRLKLGSMFDKKDFDAMFAGNFKDIIALIMHGVPEVGYLLGAKTSDKGNVYQDVFRDLPLRPYAVKTDKNEYLAKRVIQSQEASMYQNTFFDLQDMKYREYNQDNAMIPTAADDLFKDTPMNNASGFGMEGNPFATENDASNPFAPATDLNAEDLNDVPF
jgi:hypothetical protein